MRYLALATDYDGTIAHDGRVDGDTLAALERVRNSGRKLILATGRELDDLQRVFEHLKLFDRVVAENGALLYRPETGEEVVLGEPPPPTFFEALREKIGRDVSAGRVVVATWVPYETTVLHTIRDLGLELQVIFNKEAVMVLPSGVNKATGLTAALRELGLSAHNVVGIGDAENDHAFLAVCECAAAVANSVPALKERVDLVTEGDHGRGVIDLIERLRATDLRELEPQLSRHELTLGHTAEGQAVRVQPYGVSVLLAGSSGAGKSTLATAFVESLAGQEYQFCAVDPEGDYENLEQAVVLGSARREPLVQEVMEVLSRPRQNCAVNLLAVPKEDRPAFFAQLFAELLALRAQTGRPHWILLDEAHYVLPAGKTPPPIALPERLEGVLLISAFPDIIAPAAMAWVDVAIAIGQAPGQTLETVAKVLGRAAPAVATTTLRPREALAWWPRTGQEPLLFHAERPEGEVRRHRHKYAEGDVQPDRSFYFRGPEGKLNLRAQNLSMFVQIAEGVDDETWEYHLRKGQYSRWFRDVIKDEDLAAAAEEIEQDRALSPEEGRSRVKQEIVERYSVA
jgi:hypothetical protein